MENGNVSNFRTIRFLIIYYVNKNKSSALVHYRSDVYLRSINWINWNRSGCKLCVCIYWKIHVILYMYIYVWKKTTFSVIFVRKTFSVSNVRRERFGIRFKRNSWRWNCLYFRAILKFVLVLSKAESAHQHNRKS